MWVPATPDGRRWKVYAARSSPERSVRKSTMPNPKRRHSTRRTALRRSHDFLTAVGLSECPSCHEKKLPHRACPKCGAYKGRAVLDARRRSSQVVLGRDSALVPKKHAYRHCARSPSVHRHKAPEPEIRGSTILACRQLPVRVHLVGPEPELRDLLDEHLDNEDLPIGHSSRLPSASAMEEKPLTPSVQKKTAPCA